ncbi:uncharacterized protein [Physcomitrium patens]|uniref:DUF7795 domain-containing protein n=1 Tax=Physcomitrium patens TaxID=3218 RepID=A0A7I4FHK9_PHYPA|nr:uncharacterized protein LOC112276755 isoform X2 [Physcomitrium patens]|eukprot:XP_024364177.1 uncharacterized protein LOC112276755 isoform X2 [Physcomitrella patens]
MYGRVVSLEDMSKLSSQMLAVFQQELEMFRRSPLNNSSVLIQVLASQASERLVAYQEAGYRHCHTDHAVLVKLDNALKGLQNHVQQARGVMEEIQGLLGEANGIMHEDLSARLNNVALIDGEGSSEPAQEEDVGQGAGCHVQVTSLRTKVRQLFTPDYVTTMAAIYTMLQQDFTMQERVVGTLGLDLSSELLQNYQMMWTLRPFVDESVVEEALSWTRPFSG